MTRIDFSLISSDLNLLGGRLRLPGVMAGVMALVLCGPAAGAGLLLKNVTLYDGTGAKPRRADVRIEDGRIVAVGRLKAKAGEAVRDEKGLALAPGFIDMHSHGDGTLLKHLDAGPAVRQGITTLVGGQDGDSEYPLADFFAKLEKDPPAINVASMVGHGTLRKVGMAPGNQLREATEEEIQKMEGLLAKELAAGAFGLSSGLEYDPGHFATTEEVVRLAKVAAKAKGFYISHVRDEGNEVWQSFDELVRIGKEGGLPAEITHIKLGTTPVWGTAKERFPKLLAEAKRQGVDLRVDVYPYTFWQSTLRVIILDHDFYNEAKVAKALEENGGAARIRLSRFSPDPTVAGLTFAQLAERWKMTPAQAYIKAIRETEPQPGVTPRPSAGLIAEAMEESDVKYFMAHPAVGFCSDGALEDRHPRGAGAYPRILGRYVREQKVLPLETAIYKMTLLNAQRLGLKDRGRVAPGYVADLVVFDPATVADRSTIENPRATPVGIPEVYVGGQLVVEGGELTAARPGKVIRKQ